MNALKDLLHRFAFIFVMPNSQKVPTRKTYRVLVMPLGRKDLLYRFASVVVMPREAQRNPERPREAQRGLELSLIHI